MALSGIDSGAHQIFAPAPIRGAHVSTHASDELPSELLEEVLDEASGQSVEPPPSAVGVRDRSADLRLTGIVRQYYAFLWRSLRRLGVQDGDADDAAQRVLEVVSRRLHDIEPRAEKSFLFQTALRVAADLRRAKGRARTVADEDTVARATDQEPTPEEALHRKQARAELDVVLDQLSLDLRAVFVLFELEEMSTNEIAAILAIPAGTVSSRLHRAREEFQALCVRARAARTPQGRRP